MEKKIERRYVDEEMFVANDGTRFNSERDCVLHETKLEKEKMSAAVEKLEIKNMRDFCPIDTQGYGINENSDFTWYKVENYTEHKLLMNYYDREQFLQAEKYPEVFCVEVIDGYDSYIYSVSEMKKNTIDFWKRLEMNVIFDESQMAEATEKEYSVTITETLEKTVVVEAESREEAEKIAEENWNNGEYVLDSEQFVGVHIEAERRYTA